jgi:hypothetical protein
MFKNVNMKINYHLNQINVLRKVKYFISGFFLLGLSLAAVPSSAAKLEWSLHFCQASAFPGGECTVKFVVETGVYAYQFGFFGANGYERLTLGTGFCEAPLCFVEVAGGGGAPPVIPSDWLLGGTNVQVLSIN